MGNRFQRYSGASCVALAMPEKFDGHLIHRVRWETEGFTINFTSSDYRTGLEGD